MIIKRLHLIFGLMIAILFIPLTIKGQNTISFYHANVISPEFFETIDSIISLGLPRVKRDNKQYYYNTSLIVHPNKFDRSEWKEIYGEVNLKDLDVIVKITQNRCVFGRYTATYKKSKYTFDAYIRDIFQISKRKENLIDYEELPDPFSPKWYIRFRNGVYVAHMYTTDACEFPADCFRDRYPWDFDESAPHDTINSIY